jgi:hypothetical protein
LRYLYLINTWGITVYPLKRNVIPRFDNKIRGKPLGGDNKLDEDINVACAGSGDECTHEKLKPSRTGTQSRRTIPLESSRQNLNISRKRAIVGDVGLAPSCGSSRASSL